MQQFSIKKPQATETSYENTGNTQRSMSGQGVRGSWGLDSKPKAFAQEGNITV